MTFELMHGDCLGLMKDIPNKSVNLILTDPPYNIGKAKWDKIPNYIEWCGEWIKQCERVLKDNGSFYFFHSDFEQMAELQVMIKAQTAFVFKSLIAIKKTDNSYIKDLYGSQEHFRNYLNRAEYCLFYTFQDETGLSTVTLDANNFQTMRGYFKDLQEFIGLSLKKINTTLGHRRAEHCFYWNTTQWGMPTPETYQQLIDTFGIDKWQGFGEYENLRQEYESLRYTFNETAGRDNIWEYSFRAEKKYKHPTQKPLSLLADIIKASSYEDDKVLDCFMGSGSTGVACVNTNRNFIGIEKDDRYFEIAKQRIENHGVQISV